MLIGLCRSECNYLPARICFRLFGRICVYVCWSVDGSNAVSSPRCMLVFFPLACRYFSIAITLLHRIAIQLMQTNKHRFGACCCLERFKSLFEMHRMRKKRYTLPIAYEAKNCKSIIMWIFSLNCRIRTNAVMKLHLE